MNPFLWVQEIDLFHTLALLLWTTSQMKVSVLGSMWFPLSVPRRSQASGTQGKAMQNPASVKTEWDAAQCTQGFQLCPHDWDTLRKPHWLIETRADLSTWWIQMPFVISCQMNTAVCDHQEYERGALTNQSHKVAANAHRCASTKFLFQLMNSPVTPWAVLTPWTQKKPVLLIVMAQPAITDTWQFCVSIWDLPVRKQSTLTRCCK